MIIKSDGKMNPIGTYLKARCNLVRSSINPELYLQVSCFLWDDIWEQVNEQVWGNIYDSLYIEFLNYKKANTNETN